MNTKTRNTIVGVIVIVIVIGVIYYIYTNKETFRGPIKKYEYMDEIDMSEETKDKEAWRLFQKVYERSRDGGGSGP